MGFPHVLQLARLDRIRQLSAGRQEVETVWLITSLSPEQADAARLLELARQYWSIENGTHYRLDVSAGEDRCRVRHPVATTVLGILYVFTRVHLLKNYQKNPLLRSDSISLRVLAPQKYYRHTKDELYNFGGLEKILSDGIGGFASAFVPGLKMDFKFTVFPEEVDWACKDKLLAALQGIKPLYEQQIT
jgi:hypothetical protein